MKKENDQFFLERYAKEMGYQVNHDETYRLQHLLSDDSINLRLPSELKEEIKKIAKKKNIPYQRLVKSFLIEGVQKNKESA